jgi:hypothetical protein
LFTIWLFTNTTPIKNIIKRQSQMRHYHVLIIPLLYSGKETAELGAQYYGSRSFNALLLSTPPNPLSSKHKFFVEEKQLRQFHFVPELFQQFPITDVGVFAHYLPSNHHELERKATCATTVSYCGPSFRGGYEWSTNADISTVRGTLTEALEASLESIARPPPRPAVQRPAGRTDAGVLAKANVFRFVSRLNPS